MRRALATVAGPQLAARLPDGYHRMGRVLLVRLPKELLPYASTIGSAWQEALRVETVIAQVGPVAGTARHPTVTVLAGDDTVTEVIEHGIRYRLDAARVMFATGNRTERQRIAPLVRPGETVVDLFAGIGYFVVPIACRTRANEVWAIEKNPVAFAYLLENLRINPIRVDVRPILGDNRSVEAPTAQADRVILGYLPDSRPWIGRALELARPSGAWLHVHLVHDVRSGREAARRLVERSVAAAGGEVLGRSEVREVKPYGPGRSHLVVDVRARRS